MLASDAYADWLHPPTQAAGFFFPHSPLFSGRLDAGARALVGFMPASEAYADWLHAATQAFFFFAVHLRG